MSGLRNKGEVQLNERLWHIGDEGNDILRTGAEAWLFTFLECNIGLAQDLTCHLSLFSNMMCFIQFIVPMVFVPLR